KRAVEENPPIAVTAWLAGSTSASTPVRPAGASTRRRRGEYWRSSKPMPAAPPGRSIAADPGVASTASPPLAGAHATAAARAAAPIPALRPMRVSGRTMLGVERRTDAPGEVRGRSDAAEVQEHDPRLLVHHVLMDRHDVDARAAQRLQDSLQLGLQHGEVPVDHGAVVAAREGRPGIDTHGAAHRRTVHLRLAADRDLVDAAL